MERKAFFVRPAGNGWVFGCGDREFFVVDSEKRALEIALGVMRGRNDTQLLILDANGDVVKRLVPRDDGE